MPALCRITSTVFRKPKAASGIPIYVQIEEQIRHANCPVAETLVINPVPCIALCEAEPDQQEKALTEPFR